MKEFCAPSYVSASTASSHGHVTTASSESATVGVTSSTSFFDSTFIHGDTFPDLANSAMSERLRKDILFPSIESRDEDAVLSYLSCYGGDLNFRDADGNGPLHLCGEKGIFLCLCAEIKLKTHFCGD